MSSREALAKAQSLGLDLVEIAGQADPPVCKIVDYGKYKYEQAKLKKQKSKSSTRMKEVKFRVGTGQHDYNIKLGRAEGFLDTNHKCRFVLQFRGRENAHKDLGFVVLNRIIEDLKTMAQVDQPPRLNGRAVAMILSPLPAAPAQAQVPSLPRRTDGGGRPRRRRRPGRGLRRRGARRGAGWRGGSGKGDARGKCRGLAADAFMLYLFDIDGTLVDTGGAGMAALERGDTRNLRRCRAAARSRR